MSMVEDEDDPMQGPGHEDQDAEGDVAPAADSDDSSEEEEDNPEEERRIRDGFIVDEDEEEEEEEEEPEERRRRRKRRKRHHRSHRRDDDLEEDDLDLLEENTGTSFKKGRLRRLHRGRDSESPPAASSSRHRSSRVESSDDDLDEDISNAQDIHAIFDDERPDDESDIDSFIESDEDEGGAMDEESRAERRRQKRKEEAEKRKMARIAHPELAGIDAIAWDEIHDVFGDGHDYDWALEVEDEPNLDEESRQPAKFTDLFEPAEIQRHMMTEDDDLIRAQDIPERMQLANSTLSSSTSLSLHAPLSVDALNDAAMWITQRLSVRKTRDFFSPDGEHQHLKAHLVMAVTYVVKALFIEHLEVPYIWTHKRDNISHFDVTDMRSRFELLSQAELWRIYVLGQKYCSLRTRLAALQASYNRLQVEDKYFDEDIIPETNNVEMIADASEWLVMKYKAKKPNDFELSFNDEEETDVKKPKMPSRISAYEVTKKSIVSKLAQGFGIQSHEIVLNFLASQHVHFVEDQELNPIAYAEQFVDPDPEKAVAPEELLSRARMLLSHELGKDPLLREQMRQRFKEDAYISVRPTQRGLVKIDEYTPAFNFKYLHNKPIREMLDGPQFLSILKAEADHLVTVSIHLDNEAKSLFERRLTDAFASDGFTDSAKAWNEERSRVIQDVLEQHLIPAGVKWIREYVREEVEDILAARCGGHVRNRIDVAPYSASNEDKGIIPSVLAISWGNGNPQKDAIHMVFLDDGGRMREHTKLDNLFDSETQDEFLDLLRRRKPNAIVVGGFTMATTKLAVRLREIVRGKKLTEDGWVDNDAVTYEPLDIPVIYIQDDVARVYQHSPRAVQEFGTLPLLARYCVGLARYAQSPLNELAALGPDIVSLTFDEDVQQLVPQDKLLLACERALVDITAKVGVDINRAVGDEYYRHLLPFVCGLGPRKSKALVGKIQELGGNLVNRVQFIKSGLFTSKIFINAAGFLRISQEDVDTRQSSKQQRSRSDDDNAPDPLDDTRIHPEDYDLARKMASDALELDEEDIHDFHPSHVVTQIMADNEGAKKLADLNLDDFAVSLYNANEDKKRHTLNVIREELHKPFAEHRRPFEYLGAWEVLTMLSGETPKTLRVGLIITVLVRRITANFVQVRLDSGVDGVINNHYLTDGPSTKGVVAKDQTIRGVIIHVTLDSEKEHYLVELSSRESDLTSGDTEFRRIKYDEHWDVQQYEKDRELLERKKRAEEIGRTRRIIKHPNFHNFNASQAEAYLEKQQRGDVVIRPSSKGINHLAVTWKVDDRLFQHIDVTELNPDLTGQGIGGPLFVDDTHNYADLDELIVNHVQAMARRVEELMAHERFKPGSEDELHLFLKNQLAANPGKSMYGFSLNRKKPGHFNLGFLASKTSTVQTWPVRVAPEAFYLFEASAVGVPELCDAFKVRHLHESQNFANVAGSKTPYGAGGRTPARPGHATPGHVSVRQPARTPNPYGGATPARSFAPQPSVYGTGVPSYGYQTPSHNQFNGMNPDRAAMIQQNGPWGGQQSGWQ